ncbi:MAG: mechanosensitive ion channel [Deltaproteobacteria bacterium]|nr:mechanosensitive ion channel [Deltaproteobacteria bacterium]
MTAAKAVKRVRTLPEPQCRLVEFGDSSINFTLLVWVEDPMNGLMNVKDAVLSAVWRAFRDGGIKIPFPQRDVHIVGGEEKEGAGEGRGARMLTKSGETVVGSVAG